MKNVVKYLNILLLIPSILEIIDSDVLLLEIPGSPLTLGRLTFVIAGFGSLATLPKLFTNPVFKAFLLIQLGLFTGAIFSSDLSDNLPKTIAFSLMFFSASFLALHWEKNAFQKLVTISMIAMLAYWSVYVITNLFAGNQLVAYSLLFKNEEVVNHHVPGLKISLSGIYLAALLIGQSRIRNLLAYAIILFSLTLCLLTESRSNSLLTAVAGLVIYLTINKKLSIRFLMINIPLFAVAVYLYFVYVSGFEMVAERFNVTDVEYQTKTTKSRFTLIELAFETLTRNPLGRGVGDIKLEFDAFNNFLAHNQYLSFIIAGGIFCLAGVAAWLYSLAKLVRFLRPGKWLKYLNNTEYAMLMSLMVFQATLLTMDFTGLLLFLEVSFTIYLAARYRYIRRNLTHRRTQ